MSNYKVASPKAVRRRAIEMSDAYLKCRDLGHDWRLYFQKRHGRGFERKLYCPSCKTNRHVLIDSRGEVVSNRYSYVKDYQMNGLGRVHGTAKSVLRLESISRSEDFEDFTILEEPSEGDYQYQER